MVKQRKEYFVSGIIIIIIIIMWKNLTTLKVYIISAQLSFSIPQI